MRNTELAVEVNRNIKKLDINNVSIVLTPFFLILEQDCAYNHREGPSMPNRTRVTGYYKLDEVKQPNMTNDPLN